MKYLIVGLGNPGYEYDGTRHNIGFRVVDALAKAANAVWEDKRYGFVANIRVKNAQIVLLKPTTFMNLSGEAVREAAQFYKIPPENIIVVFDDISLDPGKLRIRRKGSHGGHNGMKNIIYHLNNDNIPRIKMGVGAKPNPEYDLADWVLSRFTKNEAGEIKKAADAAIGAVELMVKGNIDKAMSDYNS